MSEKHSPTPWKNVDEARGIADANGNIIVAATYPADRAIVARAVNSHDDLLRVLRALMAANAGIDHGRLGIEKESPLWHMAHEAIAKAEAPAE